MDKLNEKITDNNLNQLDKHSTTNQSDKNSIITNQLDQNSIIKNQLDQNSFVKNQLDQNSIIKNQLDQNSIIKNQLDQNFSNQNNQSSDDDSTVIDENDDKPCPICGKYFVDGEFWIQCDVCKIWYHGECVNVNHSGVNEIEEYHCKICLPHHGPSKHNIQNNHRYDRTIDDSTHSLPTQIGTTKFIEELKQNRKFKKLEKVFKLDGYEVNMDFLLDNGFDRPILVDKPEGLKMKIPNEFTLDVLLDKLGDNYTVDVINVYRQETDPMKLIQLVDALNNKERDDNSKILNCISLELSSTNLADEVEPPSIVRHDLSWADNVFCDEDKPAVQKYLLLSMKDSYTDFHIDFSGTSVWYHIYRGSKIFYFVEPTEKNIKAYEEWLVKENHSEIFFPDEIEDECYYYELKQGDTMLLPAGWIHGVYTPDDSIVFGGNFLNIFRADLQIKIFELEERQETAEKFKFPAFKLTHWVSIKFVYNFLKNLVKDNKLSKKLCKKDLKCKRLYDSFKSYYDFTLKYFNEIDKTTAKDYEQEILIINSLKYSKSLNLIAKLLEKISPYDENNDKNEIKTKKNGALNNSEDLPQKSVKLKAESDIMISIAKKRRKNPLPIETKKSKTCSTKLVLPDKKVSKTGPTPLLDDQTSIIKIQNSSLSLSTLQLDEKKRKLNAPLLTNFKIPKKQRLNDTKLESENLKIQNKSNSTDKDWDSLDMNNSVKNNQPKEEDKPICEKELNSNDDDWDSPSVNKFETDNQQAVKPISEKVSNDDWDSPSVNTFEQAKEIKSNTISTLNQPTTKCVYLPFDIRSSGKFINKINVNLNESSDDKISKSEIDSASRQSVKSFNNDQQSNGNKSRSENHQFTNNVHQDLNNNGHFNSFNNNSYKKDNHKLNYDNNYKSKQHDGTYSNGNFKQQNYKNYNNNNCNQYQPNNSNRKYNQRNYNSNYKNHNNNYNRNNYQNNSNRNFNNNSNYEDKRNHNSQLSNNSSNFNNDNTNFKNNHSPTNNNQSSKDYMDSNKHNYQSDDLQKNQTSNTVNETSSEFGSDW